MDLLGVALTPLDGGFSHETFVAEAAGERSVVRIYAGRGARRGPDAPEIDAAVLRLVRGLLPVPEVREVRRPDESAGMPGLLVTSYLKGTRLDLVLTTAATDLRRIIGTNVGGLLARLAQMPMLRAGLFVDGDLRIGAFPAGADDLVEWAQLHAEKPVLGEWPERDRAGLLEVADRAQRLLDDVGRTCLVHSDFNPKNLLVDPDTGEITGLVDWEFAHSGTPDSDLGNLLRFDREPEFAGAVLTAYTRRLGLSPSTVLDRARASDLWALVDLASRRGKNPVADLASRRGENPVADRAHDQLLAIARTGDLHAVPVA